MQNNMYKQSVIISHVPSLCAAYPHIYKTPNPWRLSGQLPAIIRIFRDAMHSGLPTSTQLTPMPASAHGRNDPIAMREGTEFDALGQQFTTLVIISTFTAILIIAFLTLAHNLISGRQDIYTYSMIIEVGQFLALIGMATHAGVIIISGRCAVLASLVKLVYFYSPFGLGHAVQSSGPHPTSTYVEHVSWYHPNDVQ
ncbi:hypothetical protein JOM56_015056 [Amanita muscaria]